MSWEEYRYIEVSYHFTDSAGSLQSSKWRRILAADLWRWLDANPGKSAYFRTVQSFVLPGKEQDEKHIAPFYIDLDAEDLSQSLRDARIVVEHFVEGFEVEPEVWFSGNRGFHITIPAMAFGATPDSHLTYHWRHTADALSRALLLETLDERVYSRPRMWRIEATRHAKTGLFKTKLSVHELRSLDAAGIRELARETREKDEEGIDTSEEAHPGLVALYKEAIAEYADRQKRYEASESAEYVFTDDHPACVAYLLEEGLALLGTKNRADMALASYCKTKRMEIDAALTFIATWSARIPVSMTHVSNSQQRVAQSQSVCRTVYSDAKYQFSCGSILACGVEVDCDKCSVKYDEPLELEIWEFSKAQNLGRRVSIDADAIGKDRKQLIYPSVVIGRCPGIVADNAMCKKCSLGKYANMETGRCERVMRFSSSNPKTLELFETSSRQTLRHRIKTLLGANSRCYAFTYETEWANAQVIFVASRISTDFKLEAKTSRERIVYLGHGLELNRGYRFSGYVWSHPRDMAAVLIADEALPLQSSLATLSFTSEELNELKIFQPKKKQQPLDKMKEIHKVFEDDFAHLFGRPELFMGVDLVYHSVRRIDFQKQTIRGWLDILILGDTGQGKSDICEKYMRYYDLGVMAAGETSSRTGLLYNIQVIAGEEAWIAFGLLPRANGHLVFVDEIHDMPAQDFRQFTQVRSKGVVDVKRVAYGAAPAETRLVSIANAKRNMSLGQYNYPVEAIPDIPCFAALEDVRRFDFCIGLKAGDVDSLVINKDVREIPSVNNPYTSELCKRLILWVWTRTPEQVKVSRACEIEVLKLANRMATEYVPDIPLVETADVRHKIIRLACAIAGRTYSTRNGVTLLVETKHAVAAYNVLYEFYKAAGLNYWGYSDDRAQAVVDAGDLDKLYTKFERFPDYLKAARFMLDNAEFTRARLQMSLKYKRGEAEAMTNFLTNYRFLKGVNSKLVKTPEGRNFLHNLVPKSERAHLTAEQVVAGVTDEDLEEKEDF